MHRSREVNLLSFYKVSAKSVMIFSSTKITTKFAETLLETVLLSKNENSISDFELESLNSKDNENTGKVPSWGRGRLGELSNWRPRI